MFLVSPHLKCLYWFIASDFINLDILGRVLFNVPHSTVRTATFPPCIFLNTFLLNISSLCSATLLTLAVCVRLYAVRDGMSFRKCCSWETKTWACRSLVRRFLPFLWFIAGTYRFAIEVTHCNSYWSLSGACLPTYKLDSLAHLIVVVFWPLFLFS